MDWQTSGYQKIKNILEKQLKSRRLPHAYLFVGPEGTGKKALAKEFAEKVIANENLLSHPDFTHLDCSQDASSEAVREFVGRIALKPFVAQRKFSLISNIENLNLQGANALLKTLEEPPENTVMVLTADTRRVLPTIISRCQVFNFNRRLTPASPALPEAGGIRIEDYAGKLLSERLLAINRLADLEEAELENSIENFIYRTVPALASEPEKYPQLAAGLKAFEDLRTNKNRKLVLQGLLMKI